MSVVVKETQAGTYYTVIITNLIFLVGGHPVGCRPPGLRFGLPSAPAGVGLGRFEGRLFDGHTSVLPQRSIYIVADGRLGVCDGAHWAFVMKKVKSPPKRSLDGPPSEFEMTIMGGLPAKPAQDLPGTVQRKPTGDDMQGPVPARKALPTIRCFEFVQLLTGYAESLVEAYGVC